ncbi:hypothetical protein QBC40DRAFT_344348 [Triangularia verruculosa]|uniref:Uncharacterized protein n=1 Tax=Triangularia verruculosa TaxID=2587418 RepID=A0AAN6X750_9PEZI|nr:hypothetical protein QBC40DRAFT_344348 [Triangularia verruculosa]
MPDDLRRAIARHGLQKKQLEDDDERRRMEREQEEYELQKAHQGSHYSRNPGAWHTAALRNRTAPEPRFPVIIGPESMFKTTEELGSFLDIAEVHATAQATVADFDDTEPVPERKSYLISHISMREINELEERTEGGPIRIWFQDKRRSAWLPRSVKKGKEKETGDTGTDADIITGVEKEQDSYINPNRRPIQSLRDLGIPLD